MHVTMRQADIDDTNGVSNILSEAALWLINCNMPLWKLTDLSEDMIREDVNRGLFHMALCNDEAAGIIKFQHEDDKYWPEAKPGEAGYVHRLAVRRKFSGGDVSTAMLKWAVKRAQSNGYDYLRLDCVIDRRKLRSIYEDFGFTYYSDHDLGAYQVARYQYNVK
ncbi:MAG: GNAT superfamily N-acetyltransferase [Gammaproteobacteria bacterium]|jgi:GNAT superfamily N-acetyltransferase